MEGIDVVYYLVHSMGGKDDFESIELRDRAERRRIGARATACVASSTSAACIPRGRGSRATCASRTQVGEILLASGVPTIVLQAGVVIGSGSTSFEMIRHLTEVLPYMPAPRWVRNFIQPIAVRDVLHYLIRAADVPPEVNRAFDIGGPDVLRYGQLMNGYAVEAGLPQRPIAALPVLTPWLAGQWVNLVTPDPAAAGRADHRVAAVRLRHARARHRRRDPAARRRGCSRTARAVRLALERERAGEVETSWRNAEVEGAPSDPLPSDPDWAGHTVYVDEREQHSTARRDAAVARHRGHRR